MKLYQVTPPVLTPISLATLKLFLRVDAGSFSDNIDESQSIAPGSHGISAGGLYTHLGAGISVLGYTAVVNLISGTNGATGTVDVKIQESDTNTETLTLDVAPATDWEADDIVTGQTSGTTCVVVAKLTALTYTVKDRSGTYTLGEVIGVTGTAAKLADQGAAKPTFAGSGYTDWTGGGFTQVTTLNDNAVQEKAYTGTKQYVRTVAKVLVAACEFGTTVIRLTATSVEDDLLTDIIDAATEHVQDITRRLLLTQTWDYYLQAWPGCDYIKIPGGNLQNAVGTAPIITWKDDDGTVTTLTVTTDYLVETNGEGIGQIVLPYGETWPSGTLYPSNPITIRFVAGWTAASSIPAKIRNAIKLIAGDLYSNRESQILAGLNYQENKTVMRLLASSILWDEFI